MVLSKLIVTLVTLVNLTIIEPAPYKMYMVELNGIPMTIEVANGTE